jgi:hypothetical protein
MVARIAQLALDVRDVEVEARFWSEALGMVADLGGDGDGMLSPPEDAPAWMQTIYLQPVAEGKQQKLRLHLDLRPQDGDVEREVERLIGLGATRVDVGQSGEEGFTVLADPEGNEFCVIHEDPR